MYLRGLNGHAGGRRLEHVLPLAVVAADVRRRAAHVEADDGQAARHGAVERPRVADHAAGRAGQDGARAAELVHRRQPAVALHEEHVHTFQVVLETRTESLRKNQSTHAYSI